MILGSFLSSLLDGTGWSQQIAPTHKVIRILERIIHSAYKDVRLIFAAERPSLHSPGGQSPTYSSARRSSGTYFPMQNFAKMRFRMSSAVVAPVMASMGESAA